MIAKINKGASIYGAVSYNQNKVTEGTAQIIGGNRMLCDPDGNGERVMQQILYSFENHLLANKRTENPILHISLNPDPDDNLTNAQFAQIAKEYMEKMNYGNQPYIVYKHEDIDRRHIHIVSVCVDEMGKKINDSYEHRRSMDACRELEEKYGLKNIINLRNVENAPYLKKVNIERGDLKQQISNVLRSVTTSYHYQTFGEYNALLSCFNIEATTVTGEHNGKPYNGIVYSATDDNGNVIGTPLKASLFGKAYGHTGLEKRMERCAEKFRNGTVTPKIRNQIVQAMRGSTSKEQLTQKLKTSGIDVVFRQNDTGRIYGVTFIDHNEQAVFNGSRLGREFSANVFNTLLGERTERDIERQSERNHPDFEPENFSTTTHGDKDAAIEQIFGIFSLEQHGIDPEEEAFARRMRRRKKKKRTGHKL